MYVGIEGRGGGGNSFLENGEEIFLKILTLHIKIILCYIIFSVDLFQYYIIGSTIANFGTIPSLIYEDVCLIPNLLQIV